MMKSLYDCSLDELIQIITDLGQPIYRADQIWQGLYRHDWQFPEDFTNLPKHLREDIFSKYSLGDFNSHLEFKSSDQRTHKTLFTLRDGRKIETVLMLYKDRNTLCISTQSGCALNCAFCATGQMGFYRNLSNGEIIQQVLHYSRKLKSRNQRLTNIVVMGMGEPFHNYDATIKALHQLNHPEGFNMGARQFTVSTVGIVPGIIKLKDEPLQVNLAISLHAASNEKRISIMPVARKYPIDQLIETCIEYTQQTHRRITFEWALINGFNDNLDDAKQLVELLRPFIGNKFAGCHVNVIPLNPTKEYDGKPATAEKVNQFSEYLNGNGVSCSIRIRRGIDIDAGCGQLAVKYV